MTQEIHNEGLPKSLRSPNEIITSMEQNHSRGEAMDPTAFLNDVLDLDRTGITEEQEALEVIRGFGTENIIWQGAIDRLEQADIAGDRAQTLEALRLTHLLGMNEKPDMAGILADLEARYSAKPEPFPASSVQEAKVKSKPIVFLKRASDSPPATTSPLFTSESGAIVPERKTPQEIIEPAINKADTSPSPAEQKVSTQKPPFSEQAQAISGFMRQFIEKGSARRSLDTREGSDFVVQLRGLRQSLDDESWRLLKTQLLNHLQFAAEQAQKIPELRVEVQGPPVAEVLESIGEEDPNNPPVVYTNSSGDFDRIIKEPAPAATETARGRTEEVKVEMTPEEIIGLEAEKLKHAWAERKQEENSGYEQRVQEAAQKIADLLVGFDDPVKAAGLLKQQHPDVEHFVYQILKNHVSEEAKTIKDVSDAEDKAWLNLMDDLRDHPRETTSPEELNSLFDKAQEAIKKHKGEES